MPNTNRLLQPALTTINQGGEDKSDYCITSNTIVVVATKKKNKNDFLFGSASLI